MLGCKTANPAFERDAAEARRPSTLRWVSQMKNLLALALLVFSTSSFGYFSHTDGIVGILMLPEVLGAEPCNEFKPRDIPIFKSPVSTKPYGKIYIAQPRRSYSGEGESCEYVADVLEDSTTDSVVSHSKLPILESGAIVLNHKGEWFEIVLEKGTAWVEVKNKADFLPVEIILKNHLAYLRTGYPVPVIAAPEASANTQSIRVDNNSHIPTEVLAFKRIDGRLWVKVKSHSKPQCDGEERPAKPKPFSGWLPFHDTQGQPTVWYFSKGC